MNRSQRGQARSRIHGKSLRAFLSFARGGDEIPLWMDAEHLDSIRAKRWWKMVNTIEKNLEPVLGDLTRKDISSRKRKTFWERISFSASSQNEPVRASAQLC